MVPQPDLIWCHGRLVIPQNLQCRMLRADHHALAPIGEPIQSDQERGKRGVDGRPALHRTEGGLDCLAIALAQEL